ncbi:MAG: AAA family ATPase [Myxococcota bacterium]
MSSDPSAVDPFAPSSDAGGYIPRPAAEECLNQVASYLRVGATQIALVGPDGIGKTLLLRVIATRLEGAMQVVDVPYPSLPADEIASWILNLMGIASSADPERTLVQRARQLREEGSGLVILLDDAASTPLPTLRRLSRITREARPSLHLVLVVPDDGRADEILAAVGPDVEVVRFADPMTEDETRSYIEGRLARAGVAPALRRRLDDAALDEILRESGGVTAEVNHAARRWWTQVSGLAVEEGVAGEPAVLGEPAAAGGMTLSAALLANSQAIDLEDPFGGRPGPGRPASSEAAREGEAPEPPRPRPAAPIDDDPTWVPGTAGPPAAATAPQAVLPQAAAPQTTTPQTTTPRAATPRATTPRAAAESAPAADAAAPEALPPGVEPTPAAPPPTLPTPTPAPTPRSARLEAVVAPPPPRRARRAGVLLAAAAAVVVAFLAGRLTSDLGPAFPGPLGDVSERRSAESRPEPAESLELGEVAVGPAAGEEQVAAPGTPPSDEGPPVAEAEPEVLAETGTGTPPRAMAAETAAAEPEPGEIVAARAEPSEPLGAEPSAPLEAQATGEAAQVVAAPTPVAAESVPVPDVAAAPPVETLEAAPTRAPTAAPTPTPAPTPTQAGTPTAVPTGSATPSAATVTLEEGSEAEAEPLSGEIPPVLVSVNAVPWARIEIDGVGVGVTPLADVPLDPGEHEFRAIFGDGREVVRSEKIDPLNRRILFR